MPDALRHVESHFARDWTTVKIKFSVYFALRRTVGLHLPILDIANISAKYFVLSKVYTGEGSV